MVGEFGEIRGPCGFNSSTLRGSDCNSLQLRSLTALLGHLLLGLGGLGARFSLLSAFCFCSNMSLETRKESMELEGFRSTREFSFPRGFIHLLADINVL